MHIDRHWVERVDVGGGVVTHTEAEHLARYVWAATKVSGRVLDIACGTGYGSRILARAGQVTGLDRDAPAVARAQTRAPGGRFIRAEVPPIPFDDAVFDWAVCFETVEHIAQDSAFVSELRRVVGPEGHLLISTPNRAVTSPNEAQSSNPFHVREYLLPELEGLLRSSGFGDLKVFYQRKERRRAPEYLASAVIARIPWLCQPGRWWDRLGHGSSEVEPWTSDVTHPLFWVIECR
jgi:SAM-dependent methyltransferase